MPKSKLIEFKESKLISFNNKGYIWKEIKPVIAALVVGIEGIILPAVNLTLSHEASPKLKFSALLTIVPIALVTISEHIGDHKVLSSIIDRDLILDTDSALWKAKDVGYGIFDGVVNVFDTIKNVEEQFLNRGLALRVRDKV